MTIDKPKVVVLGAGSLFFGREAIWQMIHSEYLNTGTLALVDTNEDRLNKLVKLANMVVQETGVNLKIEGSTDRKEVLQNADFVVLSFAENSVKYRGIDCDISEKYGIRMCSGDTIGPGDRKSTRLNSSHVAISYAVFCLKEKKQCKSPAC